jgi:ribosomal protein S27E
MNANLGKAAIIAILLAGFAGIYFRTPVGDRSFALGVWLVFSLIFGCWILLLPVLRCPDCGRATMYFDNYSERVDSLTGGHRRHVKCKQCHSVIDRLGGTVVNRLMAEEGRNLDRIDFLLDMWRVLLAAGICLIGVSIVLGIIMVLITLDGHANNQRLAIGYSTCAGMFMLGLILVAAGWHQKRRASRFADQRGMRLSRKIRIRW